AFNQNGAERQRYFFGYLRLCVEARVQFLLAQRAALNQDLAEAHLLFRQGADQLDVIGNAAARRQNPDASIFAHEFEYAFDCRLVGVASKADFKTEITRFCIHRLECRQRFGDGGDTDYIAERAQIAHEGQRIHAVAKYIGAETQRDMPVIGLSDGTTHRARHLDSGNGLRDVSAGNRRDAEMHIEALDQFGTGLIERRAGHIVAAGNVIDQRADLVAAFEKQAGEITVEIDFAIAHLVEHALDHMRERDDTVQPEQTG